jgi:hypothetical protein
MKSNTLVTIDNNIGAGVSTLNTDVDYYGLRTQITPTTFLTLATTLNVNSHANTYINSLSHYITTGGAIASPWLHIDIPDEWNYNDFSKSAKIISHEGRHRMSAIRIALGDIPVEVHLFLKGYRSRHVTTNWMARLNTDIISQQDTLITGQWFNK